MWLQIDQFRYIEIQPKTIDLSTRLWWITTEFVGFIPQSLVLISIVLGWILIYRKWSIHANFAGRYIEMRMRRVHLSMSTEGITAFSKRTWRCSVDGRKRYENDKGRKSFWKRSKTAPFSFENGLVWTGPQKRTFKGHLNRKQVKTRGAGYNQL